MMSDSEYFLELSKDERERGLMCIMDSEELGLAMSEASPSIIFHYDQTLARMLYFWISECDEDDLVFRLKWVDDG